MTKESANVVKVLLTNDMRAILDKEVELVERLYPGRFTMNDVLAAKLAGTVSGYVGDEYTQRGFAAAYKESLRYGNGFKRVEAY